VHEIKHDGYSETVRLFTRRGYDWTERYPAIARARLRAKSFTLNGEAVVAGADEQRRASDADGWARAPRPIAGRTKVR
jgi:bifunctional non-homologous end joining protein LigD